jgi:hypothetical protein
MTYKDCTSERDSPIKEWPRNSVDTEESGRLGSKYALPHPLIRGLPLPGGFGVLDHI